ncbi:OmpA family protein [Granulicella tundricola]|uniref:OmpA/MotB domain protein n=1 Tax=Granulicella tundricola (strain ATCC BAA-1859 / DSM 23138 / MP5ACTX9) TaxID=1198114 RepID=E8X066_GRATM|nr:OmpA family protein [Granulicella tundricola]ADW70047.1 OmpA/MotB domain protein [Granulicella tundricola MP5ACTX9]
MIRSTFRTFLPTLFLSGITLTAFAGAQEANPTSVQAPPAAAVTQNGEVFFYKVKAVQRDIDAVNYFHRSGSTKVRFEGTNLLPNGKGEASVKSDRGGISIHAEFKGLTPANGFGPEYLTYVLWAITPDGRPQNLGEVLPDGTKNNIDVTTALQSFGLIVTAEPYFSVTTPSDVVVLKNVIIDDKTQGVLEKVNAHATLMPRGIYAEETDGAHTISHPITRDEKSPLELYEAYNAVRIAQQNGADKYSPDTMASAKQDLKNASDIDSGKHRDVKMEITYARQAVQRAEDARVDTLRKKAAERQRNAEIAKNDAQQQAAQSQAQAEAARLAEQKSALDAQKSQLAAQQAQLAQANADALAAQARNKELEANQRADAANKRAESAEQMRERLRAQLNEVLQTTETSRGVIVNLSDALFDTGKYTLKTNTQVSLARVAGILQSYPGLKVQVEGYTDIVGSDALNQRLSENRANTTRDFMVKQGVPTDSISAAGYGKADPVADNGTAAGRAQNRRVELVVSGDAIGVKQSAPTPAQ